MVNPNPLMNPAVPIIGQAMHPYPYGHVALAFPLSPEQSMMFFQEAKQQGWQPDPGFVLGWIAGSLQAQFVTLALQKAQKRLEQLEQALKLQPPPDTQLVAEMPPEVQAATGEQPQPADDGLPDWARKAAEAGAVANLNDALDGKPGPYPPVVLDERSCAICGCTDEDCRECIAATGRPCSWVSEDIAICSACAEKIVLHGGCRRCTVCDGLSHHWMEGFEHDDDGEIVDHDAPRWQCKHCDFSMPYEDDEPEQQFQAIRTMLAELMPLQMTFEKVDP